jgi:citrate synthase
MATQEKTASTSSDDSKSNGAPPLVKRRGLEGVVALDSELSDIDGQNGRLLYRGYDIRDLADNTTFEEVAHLLWKGHLPTRDELDALHEQLQAERALPATILQLLKQVPDDANPMAVLRTAVSALSFVDDEADEMSPEANYRKATRIASRMPTILATYDRLRKGQDPVAPLANVSTAYDFLYMLNGEKPGEAAERTFDACLVLHAEHGLNASTFAGRVIGSTLSDMYSAIPGAIGALKGPLHGGANIEVRKMLMEIDASDASPAEYVKQKLARKERVMGFGHRVYKVLDPRATILSEMLEDLSREKGEMKWYDISHEIMDTMEAEKGLAANVDFFSASIYYMLGIDIDLYTPIFALSRVTGWTAHLLEQWADNRLIRPRAEYVGPRDLTVTPINER